jgi:hypothetical protein
MLVARCREQREREQEEAAQPLPAPSHEALVEQLDWERVLTRALVKVIQCSAGPFKYRRSCHHKPTRLAGPSFSYFCRLPSAKFIAVLSASAAFTFTSGSTPVPSQLVLEMGLMTFMLGTRIVK